MTKAAVKAMDAVTEFTTPKGGKITRYMVAGASKRGWTTWTTAAVDKRVFAAVPIVMVSFKILLFDFDYFKFSILFIKGLFELEHSMKLINFD
jgi:hypothetical protein